ncbi:MAG: (Fe-S)-binding protein [Anaerovibrio sp.]|uniref:L-lactate dehydrogenase (quinone) large subunit LdhH n=1 Tax=Anaerovibrio sp. TaxID=1872532 RepID=UPI0025C1F54C|nr:LUD domain-containing protein [Anaerovibrio sp.]MBE6099766.1 (Fe-S)-binding protein [Anaerovibrio sp.]
MAERNLKQEIKAKLKDDIMQDALSRFADQYPGSRLKSYAGQDIEELRENLRCMKADAVEHIDELADKFEENVKARGGVVFRAKDGDAVKKFLIQICKENGVKRVVKSKSMASEEIHLNECFTENDIRVKETDLGEWMIAIAGQKPSHMVMPAIHLNRYQCAEMFEKELQEEVPGEDIPYMIQKARQTLRQEFLQADMGITGANFGIAENGAIGLVTNEGNARLVTTLPRIHVVLIGYEKLIPKTEDAAKILRLLPRNGTCQKMTSYMTLIDGPTPVMYKKDGQWVEENRKQYVILLDNGRLEAAHDPVMKQVYQCVRCASCLNVCPIWTLVGGHVYGHIYSGGIGAILTGLLNGIENFNQFSDLCIGCRTCTTVCPGKIPIPDLIDELRNRYVKKHGVPTMDKSFFDNVLNDRGLFHKLLLKAGSVGQAPFKSGKFIRHLPLFFAGMTKGRSLPTIADTPLRDRMAKLEKKNPSHPKKKVAFFSGCNTDFVFADTGENVVKVLQSLGMEVVYPMGQSCCGKPILGVGDRETGMKAAKRNIEALESVNPDVIISSCPTCAETLSETYEQLFKDDPEWGPRAKAFCAKVREFSSFVAEEYKAQGKLLPAAGGEKVTYHDSCHMKRGLGVFEEPRALLNATPGVELVEMKNCDKCCGMAGSFGMKYSEVSIPMLEEKVQNIKDTGATTCVVACPSCMMQIGGGLDNQNTGIKVKHIADVLAEKL